MHDTMNMIQEETDIRIKTQVKTINMIQYANDIAIMTGSDIDFKAILERIEDIMGSKFNMMINKGKTEVIFVTKKGPYIVDNNELSYSGECKRIYVPTNQSN